MGARHPLWGTGVISLILVISKPAPWIDLIALSRPDPWPFIRICTLFNPELNASKAAFSAAVWAANGVPFLAPLKPALPADAQEIVSPVKLVIVTIVLLNVDWILTIPVATVFLSFFAVVLRIFYAMIK